MLRALLCLIAGPVAIVGAGALLCWCVDCAVRRHWDDELRGVLGIAKATAYDWSDDEKTVLLRIAAMLGGKKAG